MKYSKGKRNFKNLPVVKDGQKLLVTLMMLLVYLIKLLSSIRVLPFIVDTLKTYALEIKVKLKKEKKTNHLPFIYWYMSYVIT